MRWPKAFHLPPIPKRSAEERKMLGEHRSVATAVRPWAKLEKRRGKKTLLMARTAVEERLHHPLCADAAP
jgi:hypothetical protein